MISVRTFNLLVLNSEKLQTFPPYEKGNAENVVTYKETSSPWNKPRRSARLR